MPLCDGLEVRVAKGLGDYRLERGESEYAAHIDEATWNPAGFWWIWFAGYKWAAVLPPIEYTPKPDDYLEVRWSAEKRLRAFSINQTGVVWLRGRPAPLRQ